MSKVRFSTLIGKVTDSNSSRYALGNVFVTTRGDAMATDGRVLAIASAQHDGAETAALVPGKLGPNAKADTGCTFECNGSVSKIRRNGKMETLKPEYGRFPKVASALPEPAQDCIQLTLSGTALSAGAGR